MTSEAVSHPPQVSSSPITPKPGTGGATGHRIGVSLRRAEGYQRSRRFIRVNGQP